MGLFGKKDKEEILFICGNHVAGLPIPDEMFCRIEWQNDKVVFIQDQNRFSLEVYKIKDIFLKTETEIQQAYVSSVGGAVGGAMLFGIPGAIIGGRVKKKEIRQNSDYMIFSYLKDGKIEFVTFLLHVTVLGKARKIIEAYKNAVGYSGEEIEL